MDSEQRLQLLQRYRDGYQVVVDALEGISPEELDFVPSEGWTPRMVVHHLADSEMTSAIRLRRLLAEEGPAIQGYDEMEFARRLHYTERPIGPSLLGACRFNRPYGEDV